MNGGLWYLTIRRYSGSGHPEEIGRRVREDDLGPASSVLPTVQEKLVPLTLAQPGFRHLYTGRDEARPDRSVAVSVFSNRDTATAAHAQVVALMAQHRDVWPSPTRIILAGEVLVSATA